MAARGNGKDHSSLKRERGSSDSGGEPEQKKSKVFPKNDLQTLGIVPKKKHPSTPPPVNPNSVEASPKSVNASIEASPNSIITGHGSTAKELAFNSLEGGTALRVSEEMTNGEYSLKLTRVPSKNPRTEHAHAAAMLMSQGDILRKLGENLLSHLGMSYESEIYRSLKL